MILATLLLHDDGMDIIYFWSSVFMIVLPITIFSVLAYFVIRAYRKRERGAGSREQKASP